MENRISIIVPIYNVEKYLRQCLDSIVAQTCKDIEIILIDDGSPDNCGAICDEYAAADDRIAVIHKQNAGVGAARNDGLDRATGEWVMFVDPDDWLELDCCEKALEAAGGERWDIVYFQRREYDEEGRLVWSPAPKGSFEITGDMLEELRLKLFSDDAVSHDLALIVPWGKLYRRRLLTEHACRFPVGVKKRQDMIFNLYCLEHAEKAFCCDYAGYNYSHNSRSVTHRKNMEMMDIMFSVFSEYEKYVLRYHSNEEAYEKMLGKAVIIGQNDIRTTLFFHPDGRMPYREYCSYMDRYYKNEVVKRYLAKCSLQDFKSVKRKVSYFLIAGRHLLLYYMISAIYCGRMAKRR